MMNTEQASGMLTNVTLATFQEQATGELDYGLIPQGCLIWQQGRLCYVGSSEDAPTLPVQRCWDGQGCLVTPGLIDCHTHLVYAGNRANEFEALRQGATYAQIAATGGGIMRTVKETRAADQLQLRTTAEKRLNYWLREGVTTLEIKSGYGLSFDSELKMLEVIKDLKDTHPLNIVATCLAGHLIPPEYSSQPNDYLEMVCRQLLPEVKRRGLADAVDAFCETIALSPQQCAQIYDTARELQFHVKGHVEQLSQYQGTDMVCNYSGISADHLEFVNENQIRQMASSGTVAVLLPGAFYYLNETQKPPVALFRQYKVPIAIGTDHNPGSSPILSLLTAANMASVLFGLTPLEAWQGITRHAAKALKMDDAVGQLAVGYQADLAVWPVTHPRDLIYHIGPKLPEMVFWKGALRT